MYTLILIDDEPFTLEFLSTLISWEDYNFSLAGKFDNGQEAIDFLKENPVDLVISDIKMPDISGIDIAKFCFEECPETQTALISAYRDFEYAHQAIKYSVSEYLVKPVKKQEITNLLKKFCETHIDKRFVLPSDNDISRLQSLYSDLICGIITSKNELCHRFAQLDMSEETVNRPCAVFNIHINNFDMYIQNTWKYQKDALYRAISYIVSDIGGAYSFTIIRHSHNNIELIAVSNSDSHNKNALENFIVSLKNKLFDVLNINSEITSISYFDSIFALIKKKPDSEIDTFTHNNNTINMVYDFIKENYNKSISSVDAANHIGLSNAYFCIFYKKHTGESFLDTLNRYRIEKAKQLLSADRSIKSSMLYSSFGFANQGYFYKLFKQYTGQTPNEFQKEHLK